MDAWAEPYNMLACSAGNKKWISATAVADYGDSQSLVRPADRTSGNAFEVGGVRLVNRSGLPAMVGLGVRYRIDSWVAGQVAADGTYTDATTVAQNATAGDFTLWQRGITTGNGFLVGATDRFNTLSLIQSAAGDQTTGVLKLEYWNGTAWADLTTAMINKDGLLNAATGEKLLTWLFPMDWVRGGSGTNVPQSMYNVRVTHTVGAGGTADPVASQVFVGYSQLCWGEVGNLGQGSFDYDAAVRFPKAGTALFPIFSNPSFANQVEVQWRFYL